MVISKHNKTKEKCKIYLADLVHNYASRGPHTFPLNIGYIASYANKFYGDKVEIKLFKYPLDLINAIEHEKPDIVGLSNYTWSLDLNNKISAWVKSFDFNILIIYGGPDYPVGKKEALEYLKERPFLDFYVLLQGEGGFRNILERYFGCDSIKEMKNSPILNCAFYDKDKDRILRNDEYKYIETLDEIPSPYLLGIMDPFFEKNLIPIIETNRGCPYSCSYCAWGNSTQGKIFTFSEERVKEDIEYIAKRVKNTDLLIIGDANFGILKRDVHLSEYIKTIRGKYMYPRYLSMGWAKTIDRIIKMADVVGEMVSVSCSFQTMDLQVMKNVNRTNISIEDMKKAQCYFNKKGISTHTEIILGLPGETKDSHLKGLRELFQYNTASIQCYNLRMLGGSQLNTYENRKKFGLKTKYRLVDGAFGKYKDLISIECEEMVTETYSISTPEILYFRPVHFLIQFLWNYNYYKEILYFLKTQNVNPADFIIKIIEEKDSASALVKKVLNDFLNETHSEWFDSKDGLFSYYSQPENFTLINEGNFGKLNYKYSYKILLECKEEFDTYLRDIAISMLKKNDQFNQEISDQLEELMKYTKSIFIDLGLFFRDKKAEKIIDFNYDILKWKKQACNEPLSSFKTSGKKIRFSIPEEQALALEKLYKQFETKNMNQTLRKMVEIITNKNDLFYQINYAQ